METFANSGELSQKAFLKSLKFSKLYTKKMTAPSMRTLVLIQEEAWPAHFTAEGRNERQKTDRRKAGQKMKRGPGNC